MFNYFDQSYIIITAMFDLVRKVVAGPKRTTNYEGR